MMIFRRGFDSADDIYQRARCAGQLCLQVTPFSFWVSRSQIGVPMRRLMMIFRGGFDSAEDISQRARCAGQLCL